MAKNKTGFTRKLDFYLNESNNKINKLHKSRYVIIKKTSGTQALLASESTGIRKKRIQAQPKEKSACQTTSGCRKFSL